jgi:hypothetical protein
MLARGIGYGIALACLVLAFQEAVMFAGSEWGRQWAFGNGDLTGYLAGARRFLDTGSPYEPWSGLGPHTFIHPPISLPLFVPFRWLPAVLWWAVPILGTGVLIALSRPSPWRLAALAACLAWPRSVGAILAGNSDLWAMFAVALGVRFGLWPLLAFKPSFAPLMLLGVRDRRTWKTGALLAAVSLAGLPLWIAWVQLVTRIEGGFAYSLGGLPLVMLPVIGGWDGSRLVRARGAGRWVRGRLGGRRGQSSEPRRSTSGGASSAGWRGGSATAP